MVGDERGRRWRVEMDGCARQEQAWTLLAHRTNVCVCESVSVSVLWGRVIDVSLFGARGSRTGKTIKHQSADTDELLPPN